LFMAERSVIPVTKGDRMRVAAKTRERQPHECRAVRPLPHSAALLAWYDRHRRKLPWRAAPGEIADPYRVWLSEIMLQQTTVKTVARYFAKFFARWMNVHALAAAPLSDVLSAWAGLGYYARARNLHACARVLVERHDGQFPRSEEALRDLPGIGPYTAAAIAAIAYDAPATPVDGNVERVVARLFAVSEPLPGAKTELQRLARALTPRRRTGDFAQAMMDLGATICTPKRPACALCPWMEGCAGYGSGNPVMFPQRKEKREGSLRRGAAFVALREDGFLLVRTRPAKGLLGGMTEVPTSDWSADFDEARASEDAPHFHFPARSRACEWRRIQTPVRHVFTHFPLELSVYWSRVPARARAPAGTRWIACSKIDEEALPSVMRKVVARALDAAL
jgi:A/G-specific adenine glycosylase